MPVLERLCPLPGTARAGARRGGQSDADERILGKIRALLAKAEATEFPDEAEALSARAQELMAKHSIDHALLAAQYGSKEPGARGGSPVDSPYEVAEGDAAARCRASQSLPVVWRRRLAWPR